eukprot:Amastigsp_a1887_57.p2 type:complete len:229 gc:universal Amastigsp_a1887_57:1248-562(-)
MGTHSTDRRNVRDSDDELVHGVRHPLRHRLELLADQADRAGRVRRRVRGQARGHGRQSCYQENRQSVRAGNRSQAHVARGQDPAPSAAREHHCAQGAHAPEQRGGVRGPLHCDRAVGHGSASNHLVAAAAVRRPRAVLCVPDSPRAQVHPLCARHPPRSEALEHSSQLELRSQDLRLGASSRCRARAEPRRVYDRVCGDAMVPRARGHALVGRVHESNGHLVCGLHFR